MSAILLAELVPVLTLEQFVVIGTLFAFMFVAAGVIAMRESMPDIPRGFRSPLFPPVSETRVGPKRETPMASGSNGWSQQR